MMSDDVLEEKRKFLERVDQVADSMDSKYKIVLDAVDEVSKNVQGLGVDSGPRLSKDMDGDIKAILERMEDSIADHKQAAASYELHFAHQPDYIEILYQNLRLVSNAGDKDTWDERVDELMKGFKKSLEAPAVSVKSSGLDSVANDVAAMRQKSAKIIEIINAHEESLDSCSMLHKSLVSTVGKVKKEFEDELGDSSSLLEPIKLSFDETADFLISSNPNKYASEISYGKNVERVFIWFFVMVLGVLLLYVVFSFGRFYWQGKEVLYRACLEDRRRLLSDVASLIDVVDDDEIKTQLEYLRSSGKCEGQ